MQAIQMIGVLLREFMQIRGMNGFLGLGILEVGVWEISS